MYAGRLQRGCSLYATRNTPSRRSCMPYNCRALPQGRPRAVARAAATAHVKEGFGERYIAGGSARMGRQKSAPKNAQEAHEAIRPAITGDRFKPPHLTGLSGQKLMLYSIVYKRTLASVMARVEVKSCQARRSSHVKQRAAELLAGKQLP